MSKDFDELVETVAILRAPGGCPWDREQTHESIMRNLVEEGYEAIDAIQEGDFSHFADELGDILLQVVFHSRIAADDGRFDVDEVIRRSVAKLKRRHPHVFGELKLESSGEVLTHWEEMKRGERGGGSILDGVPASLPSLMLALRYQERAARVGFDWEHASQVVEKLDEELGELKEAVASGEREAVAHELGDVLFALTNLARKLDLDPEHALRAVNERFRARFQYVEERASMLGKSLPQMSLAEMDALWEEAKERE